MSGGRAGGRAGDWLRAEGGERRGDPAEGKTGLEGAKRGLA